MPFQTLADVHAMLAKLPSADRAAIAGAEVESDTAATSTAISGRAPQRVSRRRYCNLDKGFILASKTAAM